MIKKVIILLSVLFCFSACSSLDLINHDTKVSYFLSEDCIFEREEIIYLSENYFKSFYSHKSCSDQFTMRKFIKNQNIIYAEYFEMKKPEEIVKFAKECQDFTEQFLKDKFRNTKFKIHSEGYYLIVKNKNNKIVSLISFTPKENRYNNRFVVGIIIETL